VPQYWLKPLGVTQPEPSPMPNDWLAENDLDPFIFGTGPATPRQPPQMGGGDLVLFHAVIYSCVFAAGELLDSPRWKRDPVWGLRFPWVYPSRVDLWVPLVEQGVRTSEIAPKRAIGRIQAGGEFAVAHVQPPGVHVGPCRVPAAAATVVSASCDPSLYLFGGSVTMPQRDSFAVGASS